MLLTFRIPPESSNCIIKTRIFINPFQLRQIVHDVRRMSEKHVAGEGEKMKISNIFQWTRLLDPCFQVGCLQPQTFTIYIMLKTVSFQQQMNLHTKTTGRCRVEDANFNYQQSENKNEKENTLKEQTTPCHRPRNTPLSRRSSFRMKA